MKNKIVSAAEAVAIIRDGDTIAKLGEALSRRRVAPHIFETSGEAHAFVQSADVKDPPGPAA